MLFMHFSYPFYLQKNVLANLITTISKIYYKFADFSFLIQLTRILEKYQGRYPIISGIFLYC